VSLSILGPLVLASAPVIAMQASAQETPALSAQVPNTPDGGEVEKTADVTAPSISPPVCCKLLALTPVELEIMEPASSRTSQIGQKVRIRTAAPLTVDGQTILPAGTEGFAEVIQASKARMMGKGGELVLGLPYLEFNGQRIPLKRMRYGPSTGKGNDTVTAVAVATVGLAGLLISGGNIDVMKGARANAVVTTDTFVPKEN